MVYGYAYIDHGNLLKPPNVGANVIHGVSGIYMVLFVILINTCNIMQYQ